MITQEENWSPLIKVIQFNLVPFILQTTEVNGFFGNKIPEHKSSRRNFIIIIFILLLFTEIGLG